MVLGEAESTAEAAQKIVKIQRQQRWREDDALSHLVMMTRRLIVVEQRQMTVGTAWFRVRLALPVTLSPEQCI